MKIYPKLNINYDKFKREDNKKISFKCTPIKPDISLKGNKLDLFK